MNYYVSFLKYVFILTLVSCNPKTEKVPPNENNEDTWAQITEIYEGVKESGQQLPTDIYQWIKQDYKSAGRWEYKVIEGSMSNPTSLQNELNTLGIERWECIWIHQANNKTVFIYKRPKKSYLRKIPFSDLIKFIPEAGGQ